MIEWPLLALALLLLISWPDTGSQRLATSFESEWPTQPEDGGSAK